jgi:hypothetical protein
MQLAAVHCEAYSYRRHEPEKEVLYQVIAEHLETFLERVREERGDLPEYVIQEFYRYLECGILACGFARCSCETCGKSFAVGFSCKKRGFCPSCIGRRMADTAAHLVDNVIPRVPVRQWVLSLPIEIRYRLAYDKKLLSEVLAVSLRAIGGWYKKKARSLGFLNAQWGSVSFLQRFGSSLAINPHFHTLGLDGVYVRRGESPEFLETSSPTDDDVQRLVETVAHRIVRLLEKHGVLDGDDVDPFFEESPALAGMTAASVHGWVATGERAGMRVRRILTDPVEGVRTSKLCYASRGFSLHAARRVEANDRNRLEQLCRYVARPPLSSERLERLSDDKLLLRLKTPWADGTTFLILSPTELLERLAAIVPPPRANLVRYGGVFAPHAKDRAKIVPGSSEEKTEELKAEEGNEIPRSNGVRMAWAKLLKRVFNVDVSVCPDCGGQMRIIAFITDPASIRRYLEGVGLPAFAPPIAPARSPPQMAFEY